MRACTSFLQATAEPREQDNTEMALNYSELEQIITTEVSVELDEECLAGLYGLPPAEPSASPEVVASSDIRRGERVVLSVPPHTLTRLKEAQAANDSPDMIACTARGILERLPDRRACQLGGAAPQQLSLSSEANASGTAMFSLAGNIRYDESYNVEVVSLEKCREAIIARNGGQVVFITGPTGIKLGLYTHAAERRHLLSLVEGTTSVVMCTSNHGGVPGPLVILFDEMRVRVDKALLEAAFNFPEKWKYPSLKESAHALDASITTASDPDLRQALGVLKEMHHGGRPLSPSESLRRKMDAAKDVSPKSASPADFGLSRGLRIGLLQPLEQDALRLTDGFSKAFKMDVMHAGQQAVALAIVYVNQDEGEMLRHIKEASGNAFAGNVVQFRGTGSYLRDSAHMHGKKPKDSGAALDTLAFHHGCHSVTQALYLQSKSGEWSVHYVVTHGTARPPERELNYKREFAHLGPAYAIRLGMVPVDSGFAKCETRQDRARNAQAEAAWRLYTLNEKPLLHEYMRQHIGSMLADGNKPRIRQIFDKASMSAYLAAFVKQYRNSAHGREFKADVEAEVGKRRAEGIAIGEEEKAGFMSGTSTAESEPWLEQGNRRTRPRRIG